jgi:hypothetical protein
LVANTYSLQLNTQPFSTTAQNCNTIPSCQGWQQFVYSTTGKVFMQYWLLGYGPKCPKWWSQTSQALNACYISSTSAPAPGEPIGELQNLSLTGLATPTSDSVILSTEDGAFSATFTDKALNLSGTWSQAEFNVFGQCCGTQANFNPGVNLVVRLEVTNGVTTPPACAQNSFTAETNSLSLLPPCTSFIGEYGVPPAIQFTESNVLSPVVLGIAPTTGPVTGGNTITISGANFVNVQAVTIGNLPATGFTVINATTISAVAPPNAGGDISVFTPLGIAFGPAYNPSPIITGVSPASGPIRGGTLVTVSGQGLPNSWTYPFSFGGNVVNASCGEVPNQCAMLAPAAPLLQAGSVDITVDGSPAIAADKFTYPARASPAFPPAPAQLTAAAPSSLKATASPAT